MKKNTFIINLAVIALTTTPVVHAGESKPIDISKVRLGEQTKLARQDGMDLIRVEVVKGTRPQNILLFDIDEPDIKQNSYALTGEIRHEKVAGISYLESWNHFVSDQDGKSVPSKYFTRGLNRTGPLGTLSAGSDWRIFQLPFFINTDNKSLKGPTKITLNVHLEGGGLVEIRNVKLVDGLKSRFNSPSFGLPGPLEAMLVTIIPVIAIVIAVVILRRKKRTAAELRRIRAADA